MEGEFEAGGVFEEGVGELVQGEFVIGGEGPVPFFGEEDGGTDFEGLPELVAIEDVGSVVIEEGGDTLDEFLAEDEFGLEVVDVGSAGLRMETAIVKDDAAEQGFAGDLARKAPDTTENGLADGDGVVTGGMQSEFDFEGVVETFGSADDAAGGHFRVTELVAAGTAGAIVEVNPR